MGEYKLLENLYTEDGWLNVDAFDETGGWLNVIVGGRQIGKTYGVLKLMLLRNRRFIFSRRTAAELDSLFSDDSITPFVPYMADLGISVKVVKCGEIYSIRREDEEIGVGIALSAIGKFRGFNGSLYTDWVFDEFIPEQRSQHSAKDGFKFLHAHVTISGNRELGVTNPLKTWLMANTNNIQNPILEALGLTGDFETMVREGIEGWRLDTGVNIALPKSRDIMVKRKQTVLFRHLEAKGASKEFLGMAFGGEFSYDKEIFKVVKDRSLRGFKPLLKLGAVYIWGNTTKLFVTFKQGSVKKELPKDEHGKYEFQINYPAIRVLHKEGKIGFSCVEALTEFEYFIK